MTRETILSTKADRKLDVMIVEKVYDRPVIWIDYWGLGEKTPYCYDKSAKKNESGTATSTNLAGADWIKFKDDNGEEKEIYGRGISRYSQNLDALEVVERRIKEINRIKTYLDNLNAIVNNENIKHDDAIFNLITASANDRCKAILLTILDL